MPDDKNFGIVPIDIDLLQWNELILKPDDLRRYYIIEGIRALENEEFKQMKQCKSDIINYYDKICSTDFVSGVEILYVRELFFLG